jgi:hypothetical protein
MLQAVPNTSTFPIPQLPEVTSADLAKLDTFSSRNLDPVKELAAGRFTLLDYRPYLQPFVNENCEEKYPGYLRASVGLLWHDAENSKMYTVAIKIEERGPVYYLPGPQASEHEKNLWIIAKVRSIFFKSFNGLIALQQNKKN